MSKTILSFGDLVMDIIMPVGLPLMAEAHQSVPYRRIEPGGAGNFMIAAHRMGADIKAVGAVGKDLFGDYIIQMLEQEDIDVAHIYAIPGTTSTVVLALTDQTRVVHTFIGHYGKGPEVPYPEALDDVIAGAGAVFFQGYTMRERNVVSLTMHAVEIARQKGVPVYCDVGPLVADISVQHKRWLLDAVDVLMMTEDEARILASMTVGAMDYHLLLKHQPHMLVVKQGEKGCTIITNDFEKSFPAFSVPVIDTVGAGDCFDAAFITMQLEGRSLDDSAVIANAMGASAVQKIIAGRQAPTCKEVNYILLKNQAGVQVTCL